MIFISLYNKIVQKCSLHAVITHLCLFICRTTSTIRVLPYFCRSLSSPLYVHTSTALSLYVCRTTSAIRVLPYFGRSLSATPCVRMSTALYPYICNATSAIRVLLYICRPMCLSACHSLSLHQPHYSSAYTWTCIPEP